MIRKHLIPKHQVPYDTLHLKPSPFLSPPNWEEFMVEPYKFPFTQQPSKQTTHITPEDLATTYLKYVVYTMENPNNREFRDGKFYPYTDKDAHNIIRFNLGPGIESNSDIAKQNKLDYSGKTGYSKANLDKMLYPYLVKHARKIHEQLKNPDDFSLGNQLILLDIAHNVKPGSKGEHKNMPSAWPALIRAMRKNDINAIKNNTRSGNDRRMHMRNQLINLKTVNEKTVKNV